MSSDSRTRAKRVVLNWTDIFEDEVSSFLDVDVVVDQMCSFGTDLAIVSIRSDLFRDFRFSADSIFSRHLAKKLDKDVARVVDVVGVVVVVVVALPGAASVG